MWRAGPILTSLRAGPVAKSWLFPENLLQHQDHRFYMYHCFIRICDITIHSGNSLEITLILELALSDVKIGPARAHGNGLFVSENITAFSAKRSINLLPMLTEKLN